MEQQTEDRSHLMRNMAILFALIAVVVSAVIVLRGGTQNAKAGVADAVKEPAQTVSASPALDAPLTKSQETLQRAAGPQNPYVNPQAQLLEMAKQMREADSALQERAALALTDNTEDDTKTTDTNTNTNPAAAQPAPTAATTPETAPAATPEPQSQTTPAEIPVISEDAEDFCITDGVTY